MARSRKVAALRSIELERAGRRGVVVLHVLLRLLEEFFQLLAALSLARDRLLEARVGRLLGLLHVLERVPEWVGRSVLGLVLFLLRALVPDLPALGIHDQTGGAAGTSDGDLVPHGASSWYSCDILPARPPRRNERSTP